MGRSVEEIDTVVNRLMRRARKRTVAMITPFPISGAVFGEKVSGSVLRYMFPCEGRVVKGRVSIGPKLKNGAKVTVKLYNDLYASVHEFVVERRHLVISEEVKIKDGDKLDVTVSPVSDTEVLTEVWASFLWVPDVSEVETKSYLIEDLENALTE